MFLTNATEKDEVRLFVNNTSKKIISVLKSNFNDPLKEKELQEIFFDTVDTDWMGKFILGIDYKKLTPEISAKYLAAYKNFLSIKYASKFTEYNGQGFYIEDIKQLSKSHILVVTKVNSKNNSGNHIEISYRIKPDPHHGFKVIDIVAEKISLIINQKSEFSSVIKQKGIDFLIRQLEQKALKK